MSGAQFVLNCQISKREGDILNSLDLLFNLLEHKSRERVSHGYEPFSKISEIYESHRFEIARIYKPFVSVSYEYFKTVPSGSVSYGQKNVLCEIANYGDFFSDIVIHLVSDPITFTQTDLTDSNKFFFKYCAYPGERIIENTKFEVRGEVIDQYDFIGSSLMRKIHLLKDKEPAYLRMIGQETPLNTFVELPSSLDNISDLGNISFNVSETKNLYNGFQTPKENHTDGLNLWIPLRFWFCESIDQCLPLSVFPDTSKHISIDICDVNDIILMHARGNSVSETSEASTGICEITTDLDVSNYDNITQDSTPSIVMEMYTNCIFVPTSVYEIYINTIGFHLIRVFKTFEKNIVGNDNIRLQGVSYPVEQLYFCVMNDDYVNGTQTQKSNNSRNWNIYNDCVNYCRTATDGSYTLVPLGEYNGIDEFGSVNVADFTDPVWENLTLFDKIEFFPSALHDVANPPINNDGSLSFIKNVLFIDLPNDILMVDYTQTPVGPPAVYNDDPWDAITRPFNTDGMAYLIQPQKTYICKPLQNINSFKISSHGTLLFNGPYESTFWNNYITYRYPNRTKNVKSTSENDVFFVPFGFDPMEYNVTGYFNVMKSRLIDIELTTGDHITSEGNYKFYCIARIINFMLIDEDSYMIKYK